MAVLDPELTIESFLATLHYGNETDLAHIRAGLTMAEAAHSGRAAGLQETGLKPVEPVRPPKSLKGCA
jgi:hypothetical protein